MLPAATSGDAPLTYSLTPNIPGLGFTATTRTLQGTPTTAGTHSMTYRVEDSDGDAAMLLFTIRVDPRTVVDTRPSFGRQTVADQTYTVGTATVPLVLPAASGGQGVLAYSLTPPVPGLVFTPATRTLQGTPTAVGNYSMTYRVVDTDDDAATLSFSLAVMQKTVDQPTTPKASASPGRVIRVTWDRQTNLRHLSHYDVQVSGDEREWYSLRNDGIDWKESIGEVTKVVDSESVRHGSEAAFGLPDDYRLHYRVRRVTKAGLQSEWSDVTSACTELRFRPRCHRGSPQRVALGEVVDFDGVEVTFSSPFVAIDETGLGRVDSNVIGIAVTITNNSDKRIPYSGYNPAKGVGSSNYVGSILIATTGEQLPEQWYCCITNAQGYTQPSIASGDSVVDILTFKAFTSGATRFAVWWTYGGGTEYETEFEMPQ